VPDGHPGRGSSGSRRGSRELGRDRGWRRAEPGAILPPPPHEDLHVWVSRASRLQKYRAWARPPGGSADRQITAGHEASTIATTSEASTSADASATSSALSLAAQEREEGRERDRDQNVARPIERGRHQHHSPKEDQRTQRTENRREAGGICGRGRRAVHGGERASAVGSRRRWPALGWQSGRTVSWSKSIIIPSWHFPTAHKR